MKNIFTDIRAKEDGVAALEFALVAPMFFLTLVGIIEIAIMTFVSASFDDSGRAAARLIRTGEVQEAASPETTFRTGLCDTMIKLVECDNVAIDVRTFADFSSSGTDIETDADGNPINTQFTPGGGSTVNLVRISYRWEFFTPLVGNLLSDNNTNSILLSSLTIFQTEPFGS